MMQSADRISFQPNIHALDATALSMSVHASLKSLPEWNRLVELVRELAFLDGGSDDAFTLASGRQCVVLRHEARDDAYRIFETAAHLFNHRLDDLNPDFVGGLELGAVPLTAIVITGAESDHRKGFMVRKSPKGRGGRKTNNPPGIEGASIAGGGSIVILEDVTTTGGHPSKPLNASVRPHPAMSLQSSASSTERKGC